MTILRFAYSTLFYALTPFIILRLLLRSRKIKAHRERLCERFAYFDLPSSFRGGIWVHAVSVGETLAAVPLIRALREEHHNIPIVVTTMTVTGSERVRSLLGPSVFHVYVPYDMPDVIRRFFEKTRPKLVILMETELWPNLLHYANSLKIPVLLANARLSERSARGYAKFKRFTQSMLHKLTYIAAQSKADAKRFQALGAKPEIIHITGSIKFDVKQPPSLREAGEILRQSLGASRAVWIAASTREGEEELVLDAFVSVKEKVPDSLLILVPRHPERFKKVEQKCKNRGFHVVRRSSRMPCRIDTDIFLGDSIGEMMLFYAASDVAFVGGSLLPEYGGQNMLEPASLGLPVIVGPHLFNFAEVSELLLKAHALEIVDGADELGDAVIRLLQDADLRERMGENAKAVVAENRGALKKHLELIRGLIKS